MLINHTEREIIMSKYKNILVAVELENESEDKLVIEKAKELAKFYGSTLHMVHVVEHFSSFSAATAGIAIVELEETISEEHKNKLNALAKSNGVLDDNTYLCVGSISGSIHDVATTTNSKLIVVGSHRRHGLSLILGSNTVSIIHQSEADVFTIHLQKK
jgi:universal stress protein A